MSDCVNISVNKYVMFCYCLQDEGSYALDESKRGLTSSNTAYTKATKDKEYFA